MRVDKEAHSGTESSGKAPHFYNGSSWCKNKVLDKGQVGWETRPRTWRGKKFYSFIIPYNKY